MVSDFVFGVGLTVGASGNEIYDLPFLWCLKWDVRDEVGTRQASKAELGAKPSEARTTMD